MPSHVLTGVYLYPESDKFMTLLLMSKNHVTA